jgi:hypothetical protein
LRGRHPNVGENDIRWILVDRFEERTEIAARSDDLDISLLGEKLAQAFSNEQVVVSNGNANGHRSAGFRPVDQPFPNGQNRCFRP